jgi:hypothetical protein
MERPLLLATHPSISLRHALGLFLVLLAGCAGPSETDHHIVPEAAYDGTPLVEAVDVRVGIHYDDALFQEQASIHVRDGKSVDRYHFTAGPRTVELFERVFAALFRHPSRVAGRPPLADGGEDLDGVLEVRLESVSSSVMHYRLTLFELSGRQIYQWRANGRLARKIDDVEDALGGVRTAMRDAAAIFLVGFREPPQVQWWLLGSDPEFADAPPPAGPF